MYTIRYDDGIEVFIKSLQKSSKSKLGRLIKLLVNHGPDLGMPHSRRLTSKLYELRIRGTQEVRLFYFCKVKVIIIVHGFVKKTQRIPKRELDKANKLLLEHT